MTQPKFAPITVPDQIRPSYHLEPPRPWVPHRPGELNKAALPGKGRGAPGPDQGYALGLAELLRDRLVLSEGEHADDALAAGVTIGLRRASSFGRAPVLRDVELGLELLGFLSVAPADLVAYRKQLVDGLAHDYWRQRQLAEMVPLSSLRTTEVASTDLSDWRARLGVVENSTA